LRLPVAHVDANCGIICVTHLILLFVVMLLRGHRGRRVANCIIQLPAEKSGNYFSETEKSFRRVAPSATTWGGSRSRATANILMFLLRNERKPAEMSFTTELAEVNGRKRNRPARPPRPHGTSGRLDDFSPTRALGLRVGSHRPWARNPNRPHFWRKSVRGSVRHQHFIYGLIKVRIFTLL